MGHLQVASPSSDLLPRLRRPTLRGDPAAVRASPISGQQRAAIVYTILRCCRLSGVEPVKYLTDVLTVLSGRIRLVDVPTLMPAQWA
jgi:hypothetical protein